MTMGVFITENLINVETHNLEPVLAASKSDAGKVLMVGDDYFSDIYGGKRSNLGTVLVRKKIK